MRYFLSIIIFIPLVFSNKRALLLTDIQSCYNSTVPALSNGTVLDIAISSINFLRENFEVGNFDLVVRILTSRCANQVSFLSQYNQTGNLSSSSSIPVLLGYTSNGDLCTIYTNSQSTTAFTQPNCTLPISAMIPQSLGPDYCISEISDTEIQSLRTRVDSDFVIKKSSCQVEWYSGFFDNLHSKQSALNGTLANLGIKSVFITGIALDTVVFYTALDAVGLGYRVFIFVPRGLEFSFGHLRELESKGVKIIYNWEELQASLRLDNSSFSSPFVSFKMEASSLAWSALNRQCSPDRLCNSAEICANGNYLLNGMRNPNLWIPAGDYAQAWVNLDSNCTLNAFNPYFISNPGGIPVMCCYSTVTPAPQPISPLPPPVSPPPTPATPQPVNPAPLPDAPTPTPGPTRIKQPFSGGFNEDVDSPEQVTRIALIACLCFGTGMVIGVLVGIFFARKKAASAPQKV